MSALLPCHHVCAAGSSSHHRLAGTSHMLPPPPGRSRITSLLPPLPIKVFYYTRLSIPLNVAEPIQPKSTSTIASYGIVDIEYHGRACPEGEGAMARHQQAEGRGGHDCHLRKFTLQKRTDRNQCTHHQKNRFSIWRNKPPPRLTERKTYDVRHTPETNFRCLCSARV